MQQQVAESARRRVTLDAGDGRGGDGSVEVSYRVAGEGPPVVLLQGVGLDAADVSWRYALPMLADGHRVYAPDFPGHGESEKPDVRYTTDYFRGVLEAFLDELALNEAALVGISMGGAVALGHAMDEDVDVDRLVLVDAYGLGGDAGWRPPAWLLLNVPLAHRKWWRMVGSSEATVRSHLATICGRVPEDLVRDVYDAVQEAAVGETVASWQRSEFRTTGLRTDYSDRLADLDAETLLVHGDQDPLVPPEWSRRAASGPERARGGVRCGRPLADAGATRAVQPAGQVVPGVNLQADRAEKEPFTRRGRRRVPRRRGRRPRRR
jgi:pimeloyl-ACP methyl ester carboxylesterase